MGNPTKSANFLRLAFGVSVLTMIGLAVATAGEQGVHFYSTAAPPVDYPGPKPTLLALADPVAAAPSEAVLDDLPPLGSPAESAIPAPGATPSPEPTPVAEAPTAPRTADDLPTLEPTPENQGTTRLASAPSETMPRPRPAPEPELTATPPDPIDQAKQAIAACRARFAQVQDYTCTFYKRERIGGRMSSQHIMAMKARTQPKSVYFKFVQPNAGREAIYVAGRHSGKALVHDVGLGKLIAGTLALDPRSSMAMEDCRHPITDAGLDHLIEEVYERWEAELQPGESLVKITPGVRVANRPCTMIESTHPVKRPNYLFHQVKLYIDNELGLPIRFEAYDWPQPRRNRPGPDGGVHVHQPTVEYGPARRGF